MDKLEEVKKILEQLITLDYLNLTSGQPHNMVEDISRTAKEICQLFDRDNMETKRKLVEYISSKSVCVEDPRCDQWLVGLMNKDWQALKEEVGLE